MIRQYLSNKNKNAIMWKSKNFLDQNKTRFQENNLYMRKNDTATLIKGFSE